VAPVLPSNLLPLAALAWPAVLPVLRLSRAADLSWPTLPWAAGLRLWLLAAPALAPTQRVQLARRLREALREAGARVLLEGSPLEALRAGASGLYSPAQALNALSARPTAQLWLAGCRDETDLERAHRLGADAAVVDVGGDWSRLARLAAGTPLALYAGGAATPDEAARALACGGAGVAASVPVCA
jgi:8-oxo-dGTP diphosphatase